MSEKDKQVTASEIREQLAKALREAVEKSAKDIEALSKKEEVAAKAIEASEKLQKTTPPGVSEELMHKLKREYGGDQEKAYATAWKIHGEQKAKMKKTMDGSSNPSPVVAAADSNSMAMNEKMGKNAVEGYGASSAMGEGGGTPGLQQQGSGMNKGELCKDCGKMHDMDKCDMSEVKPEVGMKKGGAMPSAPKAPKAGTVKSEDFINLKTASIPGKRLKEKFKAGTTPDDKASEKVEAEGSGGQIKKGKGLKKSEALAKALPPGFGLRGQEAGGASYTAPMTGGRRPGIKLPGVKPKAAAPKPVVNEMAVAPTVPDVGTMKGMGAIPAPARKQGADEFLAAKAAAAKAAPSPAAPKVAPPAPPASTIPGKVDANTLAADKAAGGVGFLNSIVTKLKGTGNKTWDAMKGAGSGKHRMGMAVNALARSEDEIKKADKVVGRPATPDEMAFKGKGSMTAESTAAAPGEPAKSMYAKGEEMPGVLTGAMQSPLTQANKPHPYAPHMAWLNHTADPMNGADVLAHKTINHVMAGMTPSPNATAHTLGWLKTQHGNAANPQDQKTIKELHGAVNRLTFGKK